jgi:hypothetical protein
LGASALGRSDVQAFLGTKRRLLQFRLQATTKKQEFRGQVLSYEIGNTLIARNRGVRKAVRQTGVAIHDYSRIRNGNVGRFAVDRLIGIL